jgi:hypothetical protein
MVDPDRPSSITPFALLQGHRCAYSAMNATALSVIASRIPRGASHTGHGYTVLSLEAAQRQASEKSLWSTLRSFRENALLLKQLAEQQSGRDGPLIAELGRHAEDAQRLADKLERLRAEAATEPMQAAAEKDDL